MSNLKEAVKKQLRCESEEEFEETCQEISSHGANVGFPGFTYYTETCKFYDDNEEVIWELLESEYEDFGFSNPVALIGSFREANNVTSLITFKNLLAWYALEAIAREVSE